MKKPSAQLALFGMSTEAKVKLKVLSALTEISMVKLVEMMIEKTWEEKQDLISHRYSQLLVNREVRRILEKVKPE